LCVTIKMKMFTFTAVLLLMAAAPATAAPAEIFPFASVKPGMKGIGRTVFEGSRVEEFEVVVIGVLENALGPKQGLILGRLEGGPLEKTGVIAGMSGSPVFIDGKLVGAVAYSYPFAKETIAGITPIGEMIEATRLATPRAASARFAPRLGADGPSQPLDREAVVAALQRPLRAIFPGPGAGLPTGGMTAQALQPLALPLVFSGFDPATFEWARGVFAPLGFAPVMGAARAGLPAEPLPDLEPGGAVGVSLIEGDLDLSVTGTITHIEDGRVYAFGHPFYNLGPIQFPMKKAYVYSVFPSLYQSWKISAATDVVGTADQDRVTAVAGRLGATPHMIPVSVKLEGSRGGERSFSYRMVEDELFSPVLAYVSLLSVLQGNERAFGTSTVRLDARIELAGGRSVRLQDLFTENQPSQQAAALVAAPLAYLLTNDFEKVRVAKVELEARSEETVQSATLSRVWLERPDVLRPGGNATLKVQLKTWRHDLVTEEIPVTIPKSARPGSYTLLVSDAASMNAVEQREMRQGFVPRDLDQLLRALNSLRKGHHVYARLVRAEDGAVVSGEFLPSLPSSVLSVLGAADTGSGIVPVRTASVWDHDLATDFVVSGSRSLSLVVER
jgi:hypothetical protein